MSKRSSPTMRVRLAFTTLETREVPAVLLPGNGLLGTYYDNNDFTGASYARVDHRLTFNWPGSPAPGIGGDTFSVRWTGFVVPKFSEAYTFTTRSDDGVRLWVNGKLIIDQWNDHAPTAHTGSIALTAGEPVSIRLEYYEAYSSAVLTLSWASQSQRKEIIPTSSLYSSPPSTNTTSTSAPVEKIALAPAPTPTPAPAPTAPNAPGSLTATASGTSIKLAWSDNSSDETGFQIERSTDGLNYAVVANVGANATTYTDTTLPAGLALTYRVRAVNAIGSTASNSTTATTPSEASPANVVYVSNTTEFRTAVNAATPGTTILLLGGVYDGSNYFTNIQGTADRHIVIAAADATNPPIFRGGVEGLHFTDAAYLELRNLIIEGQSDNGINIDDGGTYATPSHDIVLSGITVRNIGSGGNQDGIKLSGVDQFTVENSTFTNWGSYGSGIDMVGCHDGLIAGSNFNGGSTDGGNGLETKGGSARIVISGNRFVNAGERAVQMGGSTTLEFFRPGTSVGYEAADITVEKNVIIGSQAAVAFVNVDGATVRFNTIYMPTSYVFRILQETTDPGFVPSRNGVVTDNIIVFNTSQLRYAVNVGAGTAPETFTFARNMWYSADLPAQSVPSLPVAETGGIYGIDPQFANAAAGDFHTAAKAGAYAPR